MCKGERGNKRGREGEGVREGEGESEEGREGGIDRSIAHCNTKRDCQ